MNSCTIYGRLGQDAALSSTSSGTQMLKFSVANNTGFGDNQKTNWFKCVLWGKRGESLAQYMKKGTAVVVTGEVTLNTWQGKDDGVERSELSINVRDVTLAGGGKKEEGGGAAPAKSESKGGGSSKLGNAISFDDDDIPF